MSSPHGTSWNYAPQLGRVTPTCSPIFLTQHENEQVPKNDHPKCAKHHENASKRMLGRLSREVPPTKRKILDRAGWVHYNRVWFIYTKIRWKPTASVQMFELLQHGNVGVKVQEISHRICSPTAQQDGKSHEFTGIEGKLPTLVTWFNGLV